MSAAGDDARTAARNIGVVATIGYAASLAGPPLLGLTGDRLGLLPALVVPLVFVVAAAGIAGVVRPLAPALRRSEPAGDRLADDQATASS
jgi:MFS family permease